MPTLTSEAPGVSAAFRVRRKKPKPGVTASEGKGLPWNHEVTGVQLGSRWWWGIAWTSPEKVLLKEGEQDLGHGNPASWCHGLEV